MRNGKKLVGIGLAAVLVAGAVVVWTGQNSPATAAGLLMSVDDVRDLQADGEVLLVDARSVEDYQQGAIPGAVSLPTGTLNRVVVLEDGTEVPHIVQEAEEIGHSLRQAGVRSDVPVVIYDNGAETAATRIFWVLDYYGHENISVLDGGLAAWKASGGELSTTPVDPPEGDFTPQPHPERHADYDYVQQAMFSDTIMTCNALSAESYEEGSIEGSVNLHASSLFEDGDVPYFRGDEVLSELLDEVGYVDGQEFLSFCGAGYMASINYFAAKLLGIQDVRMYDGSLVDWNARGGALLPSGGLT
ncbi:MAG: rhodanese-like domain-containing protein [Nitriliruptoraceae bacterium]